MNDFKIMIFGYCIHFFDLIAFIGLKCPILSAHATFKGFA